MKTWWKCDLCGVEGVVRHAERAGVWAVAQMILDHHAAPDGDAPHCSGGRDNIRVSPNGDPWEAMPATA